MQIDWRTADKSEPLYTHNGAESFPVDKKHIAYRQAKGMSDFMQSSPEK
jgi:hypothetical protein